MKRTIYAATVTVCAVAITTAGIVAPAASAGILVFDPTNYAKTLLTAERALQQVNNQIRSLQNEATMLTNEAKNLTTFNFPELQQLSSTLQQINTLMGQAQNISFHIGDLSSQFTRLFPGEGGAASPYKLSPFASRWSEQEIVGWIAVVKDGFEGKKRRV